MKRTTIMLPEDLKRRAADRAREEGVSLGELIRWSLDRILSSGGDGRLNDPLFCDDIVYLGNVPASLVAEHDDHLYGEEP